MNKRKIIKHLTKKTKNALKRTKHKIKISQSAQNNDIILNEELIKYLSTTYHKHNENKLSHIALKKHLLNLKNNIQTIIYNYNDINNNLPQKKPKTTDTKIHTTKDKDTIPIILTCNKEILHIMSIFDLILQAKLRKIVIVKTTNILMLRKQLLARINLFDKALKTIHSLTTPICPPPRP